jgi:hypothetical protein
MWTAIVGMFAAVIGFLGVIVGAAVTGFVTLRQAELATKREREARQLEREQKRKDVVDAFQRETLLALQDATMDLSIAATRFLDRKVATWKSPENGQPPVMASRCRTTGSRPICACSSSRSEWLTTTFNAWPLNTDRMRWPPRKRQGRPRPTRARLPVVNSCLGSILGSARSCRGFSDLLTARTPAWW